MNTNFDNITFNIEELSKIDNGAKYRISIRVPMSSGWIERMKFIIEGGYERRAFQLDHIKNEDGFVYFSKELELPTRDLYHYYFSFEANGIFQYYKKNNYTNNQTITPQEKWQMSVNYEIPEWTRGKVMYHIFVDRFYKGREKSLIEMPRRNIHKSWDEDIQPAADKDGIWCNDFYGGDLKGIEKKLEYIKSFGVSILYLSPIVLSQSNHRYDAADYEQIDPYVGSDEDLKSLCDKAHEMGMKIILDGVFNHTGNDSKYFNEFGTYNTTGAYQSTSSPYFPFYSTHIANNKVNFEYWFDFKDKVVCNGNNEKWRNYICGEGGIIDKWFNLGIDGLRLDVADELTDKYIEAIRTAVKRNKEDGFILGEVWENPRRMGRGYVDAGKGMEGTMNYKLVTSLFRYYKFKRVDILKDALYQMETEYPIDFLNSSMTFTSTHDTSRGINLFGCDEFNECSHWGWSPYNGDRIYQKEFKLTKEQYEIGKIIYKNYVFNLAFLPGILSIFYGDEIGMQGLGDIACRRPFTWDKIDYDLLRYFQHIGKIRNTEKHLENAAFKSVDVTENYIMFERLSDIEDNLVIISNSNDFIKTPIPERYMNAKEAYRLYNSNNKTLDSYGALVLKKVA